jgi:hypothetical protein
MRLTKHVSSDPEDRSLQGMSMEIRFRWTPEETREVPRAVREAIEMVVLTEQSHFRENREYTFHRRNGRPSLVLTEERGPAFSLAETLKEVWNEYLVILRQDFDDMPYHPSSRETSFHSKRTFLNRMELIDALLRIDFFEGDFWNKRSHYTRRNFNADMHDRAEQSVRFAGV